MATHGFFEILRVGVLRDERLVGVEGLGGIAGGLINLSDAELRFGRERGGGVVFNEAAVGRNRASHRSAVIRSRRFVKGRLLLRRGIQIHLGTTRRLLLGRLGVSGMDWQGQSKPQNQTGEKETQRHDSGVETRE